MWLCGHKCGYVVIDVVEDVVIRPKMWSIVDLVEFGTTKVRLSMNIAYN